LGLRANLPQFVLFSVLTLWIGWFLGMERVVVPVLASDYFHVSSFVLVMSFIASFGFTKAILNMFAGRWSDGVGRRPVLILGWLLGIPVPFILIFAPDWSWVVAVNILMGFNQALTWTMTVTSKIDLVGPSNRGLALGINEFAGYVGQASGGVISGLLAAYYGLRPYPFYFGLAVVLLGLAFSFLLARETKGHAQLEARMNNNPSDRKSFFGIFATTTWRDRTLFSCSQAGLVEKFTDTLVWALYPLFLVAERVSVLDVALIVGVYQLVWGVSQLFTGVLSDRIGRKPPIVSGMWLMSVGILLAARGGSVPYFYLSSVVVGLWMALVYPVLLAVVADVARPEDRGGSLGVYRFWRDSEYGFGAAAMGIIADASGMVSAFYFSTLALLLSGFLVLIFMKETLHRQR
jgi:MFS family permease